MKIMIMICNIMAVIHWILGLFILFCLGINGFERHPVLMVPLVFILGGCICLWLSRTLKMTYERGKDSVQMVSADKFTYVVDLDTLIGYINRQIQFGTETNLELFTAFNLYVDGQAHYVEIGCDAHEKCHMFHIYYDNKQVYETMDDFICDKLHDGRYFKIELLHTDDVILNKYNENHPELWW